MKKSFSKYSNFYKKNNYALLTADTQIINTYKLIVAIIVYFSKECVGIRKLQHFISVVLDIPISLNEINKTIQESALIAKKIMNQRDIIAGELSTCVELDSTWKGKRAKVLGAIDKDSSYLFLLERIKNEKKTTLKPYFQHLATLCFNLKVIITDMGSSFLPLIPQVFKTVFYKYCNVHILRDIYRSFQKRINKYRDLCTKCKERGLEFKKAKIGKDRVVKKHWNARYKETKLKFKRYILCNQEGIPCNSEGRTLNPRMGVPSIIKIITAKINKSKTIINNIRKSMNIHKQKLEGTRLIHQNASQLRFKAFSITGPILNLQSRFKRMVREKDPKTQLKLFDSLLKCLKNARSEEGKRLYKFMTKHKNGILVPDAPSFPREYTPNRLNTNTIEGIFSRVRIFLDHLRVLHDSDGITSRLILFRYFFNEQESLSGANRGNSPSSRIGLPPLPADALLYLISRTNFSLISRYDLKSKSHEGGIVSAIK